MSEYSALPSKAIFNFVDDAVEKMFTDLQVLIQVPSGDITPHQSGNILRIKEELTGYLVEWQNQNAPGTSDPEACPGCGCMPGEWPREGCDHEDGCGYLRKESHWKFIETREYHDDLREVVPLDAQNEGIKIPGYTYLDDKYYIVLNMESLKTDGKHLYNLILESQDHWSGNIDELEKKLLTWLIDNKQLS